MNRVEYRAQLEQHGMSRELADLIAHANETVDGGHVTRDYMDAALDRLTLRASIMMVSIGAFYTAVLFFLLKGHAP